MSLRLGILQHNLCRISFLNAKETVRGGRHALAAISLGLSGPSALSLSRTINALLGRSFVVSTAVHDLYECTGHGVTGAAIPCPRDAGVPSTFESRVWPLPLG